MADVTILRAEFEGSSWKWAFADALIRIRPDMNPDAADEVADSQLAEWRDLEPGLAAQRWAEGPLQTVPRASNE